MRQLATRTRKTYLALATVAALTLGVLVGVAVGAGLNKKSATVDVDPGEIGTVTAKCEQGEKLLSGGFKDAEFTGQQDTAPLLVPNASRKQGGKKWTVEAQNLGEQDGNLTAHVYCREGRKLAKESASVNVAAQGAGTATAECNQGQKVRSGGFENPDYGLDLDQVPALLPFESRKQGGRKWVVSAFNFSAATGKLTAYAYCGDGKGLKKVSETTEVPVSDFDTGQLGNSTATAKCNEDQRVISGGFDNPDFGAESETDPQLFPNLSQKSGSKKWKARGINNSSVEPGTWKVFAYCEKK
jgi:hypothetical protein